MGNNNYEFPCYPGDDAWYIVSVNGNPLYVQKDVVQMVGFTTRSVQIKLRYEHRFGRTFTWNKDVFPTEQAAKDALLKLKVGEV